MADDMGAFRIDVEVENPARPGVRSAMRAVLVASGVELSWFPARVLEAMGVPRIKLWRFRTADGGVVERWTGAALVHVGATCTSDEVVFAEPGDMSLLGARSLAGLNLQVDPVSKTLVDGGPAPAALAT